MIEARLRHPGTINAEPRISKKAAAAGRGSFSLDGKMIDIPVVVRAEKLLKRFEAIKAREAKTLAAIEG